MLLITNYVVTKSDIAHYVWHQYLQRSKIESVFKFCKQGLRLGKLPSTGPMKVSKTLSCLTYFVAAYFYEIEHELTKDHTVQWICVLGGGKGQSIQTLFFSRYCPITHHP